jgi:hypothetical protein
MMPITTVSQVYEGIQRAKAAASAFCTNFFPVEARLKAWIEHADLSSEARPGSVFFFRRDQDFWHLYFCSSNLAALHRDLETAFGPGPQRVMVDVVGNETTLVGTLEILQAAGFQPYAALLRLARLGQVNGMAGTRPASPDPDAAPPAPEVACAELADRVAVEKLIRNGFDRYSDQLPAWYEIERAIAERQILVLKHQSELAALLFFETQGWSSAIRYWVAAQSRRSLGFGSRLIRHYFAIHTSVKRFSLWVRADNEDAIRRYRHYGYAADGLVDHVLARQATLR